MKIIKTLMFLCLLIFVVPLAIAAWTDTGVQIQQNLGTYEPSGVVWHPKFNSLFLVSDEGILSSMSTAGTDVSHRTIGGDFEGVTIANSNSNYVYIANEYPYWLIRYNASRNGISAKANLTGIIPAVTDTNSGIEAVAFVPNGYHLYTNSTYNGGLFYFGIQQNGKIYVIDVNFGTGRGTLIGNFTPVAGRTDLADMFFSQETKTLYVLYDSANKITEIKAADNTFIKEYTAPGDAQEGIVVLPGCPNPTTTIIIAEDTGRVMKYVNFPITCPIIPPTSVDADADGYNSLVDCNDNNANINPGKPETPYNNLDDDCNLLTLDNELIVQAESMSTLYGSNVVRKSDSIAFYTRGYAEDSYSLITGVYNITIYARADITPSRTANLRVFIDGTRVKNYAVSSSTFVPFTFSKSLITGTHKVRVEFTNDYYNPTNGYDVNLYVDQLIFRK